MNIGHDTQDTDSKKKWYLFCLIGGATLVLCVVVTALFLLNRPQDSKTHPVNQAQETNHAPPQTDPSAATDQPTGNESPPGNADTPAVSATPVSSQSISTLNPSSRKKQNITVTLSIECKKALQKSDFAKAVSKEGSIYPAKKLTLKAGSTVEDALKASGVEYLAQPGYVSSIAKLSQGAVGEESAWFFSINGAYPTDCYNSCVLKDGDKLVWSYSLDGGKDLGVR